MGKHIDALIISNSNFSTYPPNIDQLFGNLDRYFWRNNALEIHFHRAKVFERGRFGECIHSSGMLGLCVCVAVEIEIISKYRRAWIHPKYQSM